MLSPDFYLTLNEDFSIEDDMVDFFSYGDLDDSRYLEIEITHMNDVLRLLDIWSIIFFVLFLLFTFFLYIYSYKELLIGFRIGLIGLFLLFFSVYLFYDKAFVLFHKIFFSQGGWILPYDCLIIQNINFNFLFKGFIFVSLALFLFILFIRFIINYKKHTMFL